MGRHSAPVAFDAPTARRDFDGAHPITDPLLLPIRSTEGYRPGGRPAVELPTPGATRAIIARAPERQAERAANQVVTQHHRVMHPRAVAPVSRPLPIAVEPRLAAPSFTDTPIGLAPHMRAAGMTTAPIPLRASGPVTAAFVSDPDVDEPPRAFGRRRTAVLTACAIAVLGGVSTAAAILPGTHAAAAAEGRCVDITAQPRPAARLLPTQGHSLSRRLGRQRAVAAFMADDPSAGSDPSVTSAGTPSASSTPSASGTSSPSGTSGIGAASTTQSSSPSAPGSDAPAPTSGGGSGLFTTLASVIGGLGSGIGALDSGRFTFSDFGAYDVAGYDLGTAGINGAGIDRTILEMTPHTSTQAGRVPTSRGMTNNLSLLQATGSPRLSNFTLRGTEQGHLYNGLRIGQATNARVSNVKVTGVPGDDHVPPGETFGINDWRTTGSAYSNVEVDGEGVGASGFGANNATDITIRQSTFHNNPYSVGATFWQTNGITLDDVQSTDNRVGLNFERVAGTVNIVRPVLGHNSDSDLSFGSDQASAKVTIVDPVIVGGSKLRIRIYGSYNGPNKQLRSDIKVIVGGVDRTAELVQWI